MKTIQLYKGVSRKNIYMFITGDEEMLISSAYLKEVAEEVYSIVKENKETENVDICFPNEHKIVHREYPVVTPEKRFPLFLIPLSGEEKQDFWTHYSDKYAEEE